MDKLSLLERKLNREIAARKEAERLLEQKGLELYQSNQHLQLALKKLEHQTTTDLRKFEFEQLIDEALIHFGRAFLSRNLDDVLLSSFLKRLTNSSVIETAYLTIPNVPVASLKYEHFGHSEHRHTRQLSHDIHWEGDTLHLPIAIGNDLIGELIFGVIVGDVDKEFIVSQMLLVNDLLCSAINRQLMLNETIEARTRAEDSERATKEFVAMINHELRTPLNGLLGSAELMADTGLNEEQNSYLMNLTQSGELLRSIINDLLDFSKMNAGMMELIPSQFYWHDVEKTVKGIFTSKAMEKRIDFSIEHSNEIPNVFIGDVERISQVLVNLVGNAIKFTEYGSVTLKVSWESNRLIFVIVDTGVGIDKQAQDNLFDPFVQADRSSKRNFEGSGLGLAICKQLLDLMKGSVDLNSELGKGTTFTVQIPLEEAKNTDANQEALSKGPLKPLVKSLSILVVDDIRMNQIIINQMLKKFELNADIGNNGVEALDAVKRNEYDIIFMDCRMPEMDGFEATAILRSQGYKKPIIALTAGTTLEEREKCMKSGMDDILTKPYTASGLHEIMMKWSA
ncbi:ATP-binding protein [Vibrio sp. YMD68]|uniref:ATP-binding protein n=1 Tax=Vibrio sp. YMD68 TaxID=3042300 RepID=UPI00249B3C10|nr:ATP-binding protein [Vibrio sp. YMD68]WGW01630.1 ATP-binding protein [Vibrio sp. YMD68]